MQAALADMADRVMCRDYATCVLDDIDLVIPSPGVPPFNPLIEKAVALGIPVLSELELASRFPDGAHCGHHGYEWKDHRDHS